MIEEEILTPKSEYSPTDEELPFVPKSQWELKRFSWARVWDYYEALCCRIVYEPNVYIGEVENEFLLHAEYYFKTLQNPDFVLFKKKKFLKLSSIITNYAIGVTEKDWNLLKWYIKPSSLLFRYLPSARDYFGNLKFRLHPPPPLKRIHFDKPRTQRHRNHIGVGYRDKGNKKFPHINGSPDWKEVYCNKSEYFRIYPNRFYNLDYVNLLYEYGEVPNEFGIPFSQLVDEILDDSD